MSGLKRPGGLKAPGGLRSPKSASSLKSPASDEVKIKVGDKVFITGVEKEGVIKFIGTTKFKPGKWIGIVLDHAGGKNNGTVAGVKYFDCKDNHGLFVKTHMVKPLSAAPAKTSTRATSRIGTSSGLKKTSTDAKKGSKKKISSSSTTAAKPAAKPTRTTTATTAKPKKTMPSASLKELNEAKRKIVELKRALAAAETKSASAPTPTAEKSEFEQSSHDAIERRLNDELAEAHQKAAKLEGEVAELKAKCVELEEFKKFESESKKLKDEIASLTEEKELNDETVEELSTEVDLVTAELTEAMAELEALRSKTTENMQSMISALPSDQAAVAKLKDENEKLANALRKLRDTALTTQQKLDSYTEETESELTDLRTRVIKVDKLEEDLETAKVAMEDMRETIEEQSSFEEMVETLSDKNMEYDEQVKALKATIEEKNSLLEQMEEMEEEHLELETALTSDLEAKEVEVAETYRQLQMKITQIDDLNATGRSFRELVTELESQNEELIQSQEQSNDMSATDSERARKQRQQTMRMQRRVNEVRKMTAAYQEALLRADESTMRYSYLKSFIPDNVDVSEPSIHLLVMVDRLKAKGIACAKLLDDFYGSSSREGKLSVFAYSTIDKLMDFVESAHKLAYYLRLTDMQSFDAMVSERESLSHADDALDELMDTISKDEFNEGTNLDALHVSHENIIGFVAAHFPQIGEREAESTPTLGLMRRGPALIALQSQRVCFNVSAVISKTQELGDLLAKLKPVEGEEGVAKHTQIFDQISTLARANLDQAKSTVNLSATYAASVNNKASHNPAFFAGDIEACKSRALGANMRMQELVEWVGDLVNGHTLDNAEDGQKQMIEKLTARFETEAGENRLLVELSNVKEFVTRLTKKVEEGEKDLDASGFEIPPWEMHAMEVRQELTQTASLKVALEEATKQIDVRARELSLAKKIARDMSAKVDLLSSKLEVMQNKSSDVTELKLKVELLEKREEDYKQASELINADAEKFAKANKALRKKILKLKYELKRLQDSRGGSAGGGGGGSGIVTLTGKHLTNIQVASEEITMLFKTIGVLREQVAEFKTREKRTELLSSLAPLPVVKHMAMVGESKQEMKMAIAEQKGAVQTPLADAKEELKEAQSVSNDIITLTNKLHTLRASPTIVDLSKDGGQQWLCKQLESQSLAQRTAALKARVAGILGNNQSNLFRALACTVPARADAAGKAAGTQLVGKLTIPSSSPLSGGKVSMTSTQFAQLHAIFA